MTYSSENMDVSLNSFHVAPSALVNGKFFFLLAVAPFVTIPVARLGLHTIHGREYREKVLEHRPSSERALDLVGRYHLKNSATVLAARTLWRRCSHSLRSKLLLHGKLRTATIQARPT